MTRDLFRGNWAPAKLLPTCILLLVLAGCDSIAAAQEVSIRNGITYAEVDGQKLLLDLAVPLEGDGPFPLIICLHGGGWSAGHRSDVRWLLPELSKRGYAAATVSYRLAPEYPLPAQIHDVKAAVRFLRAHARHYNLDPHRFGAIGFSAGGHLAMMLGLTGPADGLEGQVGVTGPSSKVQAVVNYVGAGDLRGPRKPLSSEAEKIVRNYYHKSADELWKSVFGTSDVSAPIYATMSPIVYADASDAPVLTFMGTEDEFISLERTHRFDEEMKAAGAQHELVIMDAERHNFSRAAMQHAAKRSYAFLDIHLLGAANRATALAIDDCQSFDMPQSLARFVFSDPGAWELREGALELVRQSEYEPPHRSPVNIALIANRQYGSFTLEADVMSTAREYGHRDMCLFFNFQDPAHFYYAHIATATDDHAHNIFIVHGADRKKISTSTTKGHDWGKDKWHRLKLVRDAESGLIELHVNGEKVMEAYDKSFTGGHIGFGSFDDTGRIDNVRIIGQPVSMEKTGFFKSK